MNSKKLTDYFLKIILLSVALIPLVYFNQVKNVPVKAFILGTGSWGIGLIFKMISHQLIVKKLQFKNISPLIYSSVNGFLSGFFELSAAYLIIILMKDKFVFNFDAIISFGLAIGSLETIIVVFSKDNGLLKGTAIEKHSEKLVEYLKTTQGADYYIFNLLFPVIERINAAFIHISTRGLVFLTIITGNIYPILIALFVFIIADGVLVFYYYVMDKLLTKTGLIKFFIYITILSVFSFLIFIILAAPYRDFVL